MPQMIRKALISAFGDESNINVVSETIDDPARGEVQIRVLYSGFGGSDINMRLGRYPNQKAAPLVPGYCLVGTVQRNGSGSRRFSPGTMVCSLTMYDAEAELANVPEKYLFSVPHGLDVKKVCALILDWMTAYGMVHRSAHVKAGQKVFIHSLSGAVGMAAGALCQLQGAQVYGTASQRNHDMLRSLGFEPFVYSDKNWMTAMINVGGAEAVFDPLGYESWDESYQIMSHNDACLVGYGHNLATMSGDGERGGKFASTVKLLYVQMIESIFETCDISVRYGLTYILSNRSRNLMCPIEHRHTRSAHPLNHLKMLVLTFCRFFYITKDDKTFEPELQTLFDLLSQGKIDVKIKAIFDLEDIQEAHRAYTKGSSGVGSMLINVGDKRQ